MGLTSTINTIRLWAEYVTTKLLRLPYFGPLGGLGRRFIPGREPGMLYIVQSLYKERGPLNVLEVGSDSGHSACLWLPYASRLVCVDLWEGHRVFRQFQRNIKYTEKAGIDRVWTHHGDSRHILGILARKFDLVYIDGSHVYPDVTKDLQKAGPLVKDGGILCGDDLELQAHQLTAAELVTEAFHPGVTRAVVEYFGGPVWAFRGFFAMRKRGDGWILP